MFPICVHANSLVNFSLWPANAEIGPTSAHAISDIRRIEYWEDQVQGFWFGWPSDRTPSLEGLLCQGMPCFFHRYHLLCRILFWRSMDRGMILRQWACNVLSEYLLPSNLDESDVSGIQLNSRFSSHLLLIIFYSLIPSLVCFSMNPMWYTIGFLVGSVLLRYPKCSWKFLQYFTIFFNFFMTSHHRNWFMSSFSFF